MFKPTYDRLVVEPLPKETVTLTGLILPTGRDAKMCKGTVVACGRGHLMPDYNFRECENKEGDVVYYYEHHAAKITFEDKEYHILKDTDPFGKIENATTH